MRNNYFDKGFVQKTPFGQFILAYNKLDSHHYALERILNYDDNYVFEYYTSFENEHFLRYFTCWEEEELVPKKQKQEGLGSSQNIQPKGTKKKTMNLTAFLTKKKAQTSLQQKSQQKSKKQISMGNNSGQQKKQQVVKSKVLYIQLEAFQNIVFPPSIQQSKSLMAMILLLAQTVKNATNVWPLMIPVSTNDGALKFVKKGGSMQQQLVNLFQHAMKGRAIQSWSKDIVSVYQMYKINGDIQILGQKLQHDLATIFQSPYDIVLVLKSKKIQQRVQIAKPQFLHFIESDIKISILQYNVIFSYIDQDTRQVTFQHIFDEEDRIGIIGNSSSFVIRYLKKFRVK